MQAFLNESKGVPDLQKNPLMLGLMCNIYRGEGYIPRHRPDVYEKCADMLFERGDKRRDITLPSPIPNIQSQIQPTIMYLANWIYSEQSLQGGVIEQKLITKASEYLLKRRFDDLDEAEQAAGEFVRFCRGRAWVFTDVGTNRDGDNLYKFTHRTFLEYFTACSLVRNSKSVEELFNILLPKIANQEWDMVCQLAFKIQDKKTEDAGDELLDSLVDEIEKAQDNLELQGNLLDFTVRCLEFIVPSPKVTKKITKATIDYCITWGCVEKSERDQYIKPGNLLDNLSDSYQENISSIVDKSKLVLIDYINNSDNDKKILALEILGKYDRSLFAPISFDINSSCKISILNLLQNKMLPYTYNYLRYEWISIDYLINQHRFEGLFENYPYILFPNTYICSIGEDLLTGILISNSPEEMQEYKSFMNSFAEIIMITEKPIFNNQKQFLLISSLLDDYYLGRDKDIFFDSLFTFSLLIMIFTEFETYLEFVSEAVISDFSFLFELFDFAEYEGENKPDIFNHILYTFIARYEPQYMDKVQNELDNCKFTPEQQALIWQWVRREIDFVEKPQNSENIDFEEN